MASELQDHLEDAPAIAIKPVIQILAFSANGLIITFELDVPIETNARSAWNGKYGG
jgi:hypothetical protein